jgi:cystathionine gamma-synthase
MSSLVHRPLGQRIPDRLHAVSCSLPTMRDIVGYEEKDPAVTAHLTSGYPRFVVHPLLRRVAEVLRRTRPALAHRDLWLCAGIRDKGQVKFVGCGHEGNGRLMAPSHWP